MGGQDGTDPPSRHRVATPEDRRRPAGRGGPALARPGRRLGRGGLGDLAGAHGDRLLHRPARSTRRWRCSTPRGGPDSKPRDVQLVALTLPRRQRDRVLAVARAADPRAANPFESVLRAIALSVPGLSVEPQVVVKDSTFWARVDLADESLRMVIEAESFEFHGSRKAFDRDCRRYNSLVIREWLVLRFTWEQVMFEPELVAETLRALVAPPPPATRRLRQRTTRRAAVALSALSRRIGRSCQSRCPGP